MQILKTSQILVTGATGFLASHVIKNLLEKGFTVRGTVRSLARKDRYDYLYGLVPNSKDRLSFVEADLLNADSWKSALEGIDYVMHLASPCPVEEPKDENEVIRP